MGGVQLGRPGAAHGVMPAHDGDAVARRGHDRPRVLRRSWVAVAFLTLIVASDYQWRHRSPEEALTGSTDLAILLEVAAYGLVAAFVVLLVSDPPRLRRPTTLTVAVWVWALFSLVSALWSPYRAMGLVRGLQLVVAVIVTTAVARHATRLHLHRFAHAYLVLCSLSVAMGLAFPFPRIERQASRFTWLYVHPVIAGTFCGLAAVIALAYLVTRTRDELPWRWPRGAYGALLLLNAATVVATITRAAIAATAFACLAVAFLVSTTRRRVDLAVVAVAGTALLLLLFGDPLFEFLRRGQTETAFRTLSARTVLWAQAWELFVAQPVVGYGLMATRGVFLEETGLGSAHNALIEVVVNTGLVGSVAWLAIVGVVGWSLHDLWARSGRHHPDVPLLVGLFAFLLVNGLSTEGPGLPANVQSAWLLAIVAWVGVLRRTGRTSAAEPQTTALARR